MIPFTLFTADCTGNLSNCVYSHKAVITDAESLRQAAAFDHVTAAYKNNYRSTGNFIQSDVVPMDCDNDRSDDPNAWVMPFEVAMAFPDVAFAVVYSRNHMKEKDGKAARPRFHIYFPVPAVADAVEYTAIKQQIAEQFPYFDRNALDSARLLFGTMKPEVELYEGIRTMADFLDELAFTDWDRSRDEVPQGQRNNTLSHYAGKVIKRYGNTEKAHQLFVTQAERCNPPLDEGELKLIWNSAVHFGGKISMQDGYIPPEQYNSNLQLKPEDFSDVGQATVLAKEYLGILRYSPATDYLVYNGSFWEESRTKAQAVAQELTIRQLKEAETEIQKTMQEMVKNGAWEILAAMGPKKAASSFSKQQSHTFDRYQDAVAYRNYAIKRRDSKYITSALKEAHPVLEIEQRTLDADAFLLNAPSGTYDLRKGTGEVLGHDPMNFITKQTAVDSNDTGADQWEDALHTFFRNDAALIEYVQEIVGLSAIGRVYIETLIIAYGEGRNGKSTFWNTISRVLGSYSGNISADMLTVGCRRNVKPELAEANGKRLLIAAELEEGMRLNTSNVKQLCSTDEIYAEKKYKDPFSYIPTHTLVLYTNHLPKVGAIDKGTWRRLTVIPFEATIEGGNDVKNYADYLFEHAGGAVLAWVIEGARKVIEHEFKISPPKQVTDAIQKYKETNDWLAHFLDDRCVVENGRMQKSGELYNEYRSYCIQVGEFIRNAADFYIALENAGFIKCRNKKGRFVMGLQLKSEFME